MLSFSGVSRTVVTLGMVSLITDISSEMVAAVLPLFVVVQLGMSPVNYGIVEGIYQVGSVITRIAGGYLGDVRSPKLVAMSGYALSAVCKLFLVFATNLLGLTAIVAVDRAGKGLRTAPRDAMIVTATPPELMGRAFGVHRSMDTFGALIGPLIAWGLLMLAVDDFTLVFLVSFCIALSAVAVIGFLDPERNNAAQSAKEQPKFDLASIKGALNAPAYRRLVIACAMLSLVTIADGFLYLILSRNDAIPTSLFPLLFVGTNVSYLLFALPLGNFADRIGKARVFMMGYGFLLIAYAGAATVPGLAGVAVCLACLGLYYASTDGVLSALAAPLLPEHLRSTGLSVVQSTAAVGKAVSAVVFGFAWGVIDLKPTLWIFFVAMALAAIVSAYLLAGGTVKNEQPARAG
jgi:MFS family permease